MFCGLPYYCWWGRNPAFTILGCIEPWDKLPAPTGEHRISAINSTTFYHILSPNISGAKNGGILTVISAYVREIPPPKIAWNKVQETLHFWYMKLLVMRNSHLTAGWGHENKIARKSWYPKTKITTASPSFPFIKLSAALVTSKLLPKNCPKNSRPRIPHPFAPKCIYYTDLAWMV